MKYLCIMVVLAGLCFQATPATAQSEAKLSMKADRADDPSVPSANSPVWQNTEKGNHSIPPILKAPGGEKMMVGECDLGNYSSANFIGPGDFPYTSPVSGITVDAVLVDITNLNNTNYTCGGNSYATSNPAWWIQSTTGSITLNFSAAVTNFSVVVNGTNLGEIFTFTTTSGSVSLENFCTDGFAPAGGGNQLECILAGTSGTLISINNPTGSTQYIITHNGVSAGSRVTLLDCLAGDTEVTLTCPTNTTTTACQTQAAVDAAFNAWLATASGTGGCNGVLTNNNTGAPSACGGSTTVTFTYTSTCAPLTTTCQATFTVPPAPTVVLTCPTNTTVFSCQQQSAVDAAFATWLATASASGGCNGVMTNNSTGAPSACGGSTTVTFTYTSTCAPLTTTCQATFTVSATSIPTPTFFNCDNTINLGCNPSTLPSCSNIHTLGGSVSASNSCGSVPVSCSAGSITVNGCNREQIFTFTATACGITSTCTRTYTWTQVTPPSFNGTCGNGVTNLGCNPVTLPACDPNVTASNECGPVTVTCNVGTIIVNGCNRQQTLLYVANAPGCGNFSTCQRVFNWQETTAPVFGNCDNTIDLGCNPATLPSCANINQAAFGGAITATNECGNVSMSCTGGPITVNGCNRTQVFTITATGCSLTSTCTRTFTWTVATAPVFDNCTSGTTDLGCNPASLPSCDPGVTASSECGAATVVCTAGSVTSNGCDRTQVFTYVATGACGLTSTCTRTYTWQVDPIATLTCPTNTTVAACQAQEAVDVQFAAWLATASFSGGCNAALNNNSTEAPSFCGGSTTVTFTLNATCQATQTCQATFTVASETPLVIICPTATTVAACQTQEAIDAAYANWINTANSNGGCEVTGSNDGNFSPSKCGEVKTVTFNVFSTCAPLTQTCQSTFTVTPPPPVVLNCPTNATEPFGQTQAAINAAFATWLASVSASGGCDGALTNDNMGAPAATGGSTTVTFTYTSTCAPLTTTCQATFAVTAAPPVVLNCPVNTTTAACQTQASINSAFATWLATASASGGCNGALTNDNTGAPDACGGSTNVTFTYTSTCAPFTTTCQATFTVDAPLPVTIVCPTPTTVASCQTQAAINAQYDAWVATFNAQGGCNLFETNTAGTTAPSRCGGSRTVTFTANSSCAPLQTSCTSTFTVTAPQPVVFNCPVNVTLPACMSQAAINDAYDAWLASGSASGGCGLVISNNGAGAGAPGKCTGGSRTVTFTLISTCAPFSTTCQATFTVEAPTTPSLSIQEATTVVNSCQTQAEINSAFATWLSNNAIAGGSCNGSLTNNNTGAPSACGGSKTVTWSYSTSCVLPLTGQATFVVPAPPTVVLTCPMNTTEAAGQTQASINMAFATWLATVSASGGCNGVLTNNNTGAPPATGGSTTVTFTYTSSCAPLTTTCQATFSVSAAPPIELTCPVNTTTTACQTQAAVDAAFATWLATASGSGGCNGVLTNNNTGAPSACGGSTTVTFTYTSTCLAPTTTCQATFTVSAAPTVVLTCPTNTTTTACQTQAAVNAAFATWLATANGSGGCNGVLTNNNTGAPAACGGSTTVTFTYTSACAPTTTTCQATFTVPAAPTVVLTCPANTTTTACQTQSAVNAAFATWLATASASGGCNGVLTNNNTGAPAACGGSTTVTFTYTSACAPTTTTCQATFTVPAAPTVVLTCPTNTTTTACQTQAELNSAYAAWLATASASGGCNSVLNNNAPAAPSICNLAGSSTTVTFTYTSSCTPTTTTCQATFTVPPYPAYTVPANGASTVSCLALATQPTPPTVVDGCGQTLTPTGPVIVNNPNPVTCEGTRTYTWTYTDCAGQVSTWSYVYTIERNDFTVPANGAATVACATAITQPTPPTVQSNCGETLTPTGPVIGTTPACEGTKTYTWTYTDCEGNTHDWSFVYTIERNDFTVPANGASTVACASAITTPTPPTVLSDCGEAITPTGPVIGTTPACEGTKTYTWTYTDCEGNTHDWSYVYTIERNDFTVPVNGSATVSCVALATQPTPPTVQSDCGEPITPVGPTITDNPTPLLCGGTRTYTWNYTDCEGNTHAWSFVYTINPVTFSVPSNGAATVACISLATAPTPPTVNDACGNPATPTGPVIADNPSPLTCEGTRTYTWNYTDCSGNNVPWSFVYTIERNDFTVPANGAATVACASAITTPTPPTVQSDCGETITPTGPVISATPACEGTKTYTWTYTDCEGNGHDWVFTYTIERNDFAIPANGAATVACPALATQPTPPTVLSDCGETIVPTGPVVSPTPVCEGTKTYTWNYTDCEGNSHDWVFIYTIERQPFTIPTPNGASTVACPALAVTPTPPTVSSNCGEVLTPSAPAIINAPNPLTCEGTRTYAFTYTDCEGNTAVWSFVYTIERLPFTIGTPNGSATVACPANATQPTPPTVQSNCGETIVPTGPVISNVPNPLTCEGTRTYAWVYTDCEGNTATWSFVYTIERQPFTVPANGGSTVACPAQTDAQPTPPVVTSNCGETLTPVIAVSAKPICEGTRTYTFTYTDCEGNTSAWKYTYTVEYSDFVVPASVVNNVECPVNAILPTPPTVSDNCGNLLVPVGPVVTTTSNAQGCEGSRKYEWTYRDCEGNTHLWSTTYNFLYSADFFAPADEENYVTCVSYAVAPVPQTLFDFCGQVIKVSGPTVEESIADSGCTGWRKFSYVYTDCGGHSHPWSFTYHIDDNEGPLGTCPNGTGAVSVNVANLECIEEVPCPEDYDFSAKIQELIQNGNYYDVCSGGAIKVALDDATALWECSDADGNGVYTFGRTFYFRITDACGNEAASLCEITYSGVCQPLETFAQADWGIAGDAPGSSVSANTTDLQVIESLISSNPLVIGGTLRSLTVSDAQCIVNLLPGIGTPGRLANCHQFNCNEGCNPLGIGGMKNSLAANTIALTLNIRYNVQYNELTMTEVRSQGLSCISINPNIVSCDANGTNCVLRIFDQNGQKYDFPYTLGGLLDLANLYLGGPIKNTTGQSVLYSPGINESLMNVNAYWSESQFTAQCGPGAAPVVADGDKALPKLEKAKTGMVFSLAPNPTDSGVTLSLSEMESAQEVTLVIYNQLGQQVLVRKFGQVAYLNERIDLDGIGSGLYIVSLRAGGQQYEQKLVISKE